jgi:hypothetical protein
MTGLVGGYAAPYLQWGFFSISAANLIVIALMLAVFVAAILAPFPRGRR